MIDDIIPIEHETTEEIFKKSQKCNGKNCQFFRGKSWHKLDKCNQWEPARDGKQSTVARFKSRAFKENVYQKQKEIIGTKIKVKLSLTKRRTRTIKYAHQIAENNTEVTFVYADINGNLKLRLHSRIGNKYVCEFRSKKIFDWEIFELNN